MEFLNRAFAQISELFRSMTPGARITAGLLLTVVIVSLAYLFNHQSTSADYFLLGGDPIPSVQLPAIEAAFSKAKLSGYEIDASHRIRVPSGQKATYMAALADANALPKGFGDYIGSMMKETTPWMPRSQQKEMLKLAQEKELAQIISSMRGMESASVIYDEPTDTSFHEHPAGKTASVSVKPQGNDPLEEERVESIRQLVGGAIGCKPTDVSVVDLNTNRSFAGGPDATGGAALNNYQQAKKAFEKDWQSKILAALAAVPGAIVNVNVELNPESFIHKVDSKVDPKPVPAMETENTSTNNTSSNPQGGGRPGLASQGGVLNSNTAASLGSSTPQSKSEQEVTSRTVKNAVSQTQTETQTAGFTPSHVTVTIGVLSSYYEKIWNEQNPTPAGAQPKAPDAAALQRIETETKSKLKDYVTNLIPLPQSHGDNVEVKDPRPDVQVVTFQHLASAPIAPPTFADQALFWLSQYWTTLGMGLLGLVSLLILRSIARSIPATAPRAETAPAMSAAAVAGELSPALEPEPERQDAAARLKRRAKSGPSLRDELVDIVREDPDAAANILRNWIGAAT